ncbi:DUF6406 domain-containing protein [Actinomadura fibrosa]|uniref:DUF6406 domain-containing protein n=1 Tax=Actinomadura fibrosa TaxID=111802 RepID=A0ABW2Y0F8_9ACTN|nr:DUF6406 domain-containing protein [Actinomadura fibrosa]
MALESISLQPNQQWNSDLGSLSVVHVVDRQHPRGLKVQLLVAADGEENYYDLHEGDTFPVAGAPWKLDRILTHDDVRWTVLLEKVT